MPGRSGGFAVLVLSSNYNPGGRGRRKLYLPSGLLLVFGAYMMNSQLLVAISSLPYLLIMTMTERNRSREGGKKEERERDTCSLLTPLFLKFPPVGGVQGLKPGFSHVPIYWF